MSARSILANDEWIERFCSLVVELEVFKILPYVI